MAFLRLRLLGAPRIERDGQPLHFARRRALALGIYLAVTGHAHGRDALTTLFWPEADSSAGRANLRRSLYALGHTVGQDFVVAEDDQVRFIHNGNLWMDLEQFRGLVAACHQHDHPANQVCGDCLSLLTQAADLYRDDFLAGFTLPDSPDFDRWQFFQGEQLRTEMALVLDLLMHGYADRTQYMQAMVYAQRRLALDPLHEPTHRHLMQLYAWSDQPAAAQHQYELCTRLLAAELDVDPAPETTALHRAILARRLAPPRPTVLPLAPTPRPVQDDIRLVSVVSVGLADSSGQDDVDLATHVETMANLAELVESTAQPFGGHVEHVVGEDILALYGHDQVHEDDAERAVRTALAVRQAAQDRHLPVRIGINTGMAYCGRPGSSGETTVMGPVVNLATRLRNRAERSQILVGRQTYLPTRGLCDYAGLSLTLPGVAQEVPAYAVVRRRSRAEKARGVEGLHAELVGRQAEMARLQTALQRVQAGEGSVVTLAGAAGVGKSRLVAELKRSTFSAADAAVRWLEGRGLEHAMQTSYWLFVDLLRGYFSHANGDGDPSIARRVADTLHDLVQQGHLSAAEADEIGPLLGRLLALRYGNDWDERLQTIAADQVRRRMRLALQRFLVALARVRPLVLVLEDLHWADALSLELIAALMESVSASPLLLLCLYRPAQTEVSLAELAQRTCPQHHMALSLHELTPAQSRQLVASLLAIEQLPDALHRLILDKAQGNPFFLEEWIRALIDAGVLYREGDIWRAHGTVTELAVPESVQSVILSRVDRLGATPRQVLQMAAVLGRIFRPRVLAAMAGSDVDVMEALAQLEKQAFVYLERSDPESEYSFHHVLVQDAVYQDLPKARRARLHGRAAQAIEAIDADNLEPYVEQLAYHYAEGAMVDKAIVYLLQAGRKAQNTYANREALAYFRRAQRYLDQRDAADPWQRLAVLEGIGQVYAITSDLRQGEPYLRQAIALAQELDMSPAEQVQRYFPLCHLLRWHGKDDALLALVADGLALLGNDLTQPEAVMLLTLESDVYFNRGQHRRAMALIAQIVEVLPDLAYRQQLQSAYNMLAMWCRYTKQVDQGLALLAEIEKEALAQQDLWLVGYLHGWPILFLYETIGDLERAFESLRKVEEIAAQTGDEMLHLQACTFRGIAHGWCAGDWERATAYAQEVMRLTEQTPAGQRSVFAHVTLGLAHASGHAWVEAAAVLEIARRSALAQNLRAHGERCGDIGLAWSYLHLGRRDEAAALFHAVAAEEEADIESLHQIACALAGLATACPDAEGFQAQCKQIAAERAGVGALPLVQWHAERAEPSLHSRVLDAELPTTERKFAQQGWQWQDPFADGSYTLEDGLTIRAANYRDLWLNNLGAPRLLHPVQGSFVLEAHCTSGSPERPALGGLVLWKNQENYLRLSWNTHGPGEINLLGCVRNRDVLLGRGALPPHGEQVYLRLERTGIDVRGLYSIDGENWYSVGTVEFPVSDSVDVGLVAVGFIPRYVYPDACREGTAIRFASIALWHG